MDVMMERERDRNERLRELGMKSGRLAEELKRENRMPYDRAILERERFGIVGTGPDRLQERDRLVERVVVKERDEKGMAVNTVGVGIDRLDKVAGVGERNEDKEGTRVPATRVNVFERLRALEREREEERERMREKAREEDQERGEEDEVLRELVSQYKTALLELTFNSKPIITNLTIIAGENLHAARGLAGAVCSHIIEVPKEQKLPSLYLLDSIVKNIGGDYVKYFAQRLPEVFCRAYKQVDPATHPAMQHLFKTWRGVFPPAPLRTIEGELQFQPAANGPLSVNNLSRQAETPAQRTGHAIHVNPKYIEAQRRLQQSGKVDAVPAERNGDTAFREPDRGLAQESSKGWSDTSISRPVHHRGQQGEHLRKMGQEGFDQASYPLELENAKPEVGIARGADRYHGWDRLPEGDGAFNKAERASDPRKSHDWRPPLSRSSNVDAFSDSRPGGGKGAASLAPLPQPSQGTTHKSVPSAGNWQNSEDEEEYVWEDMSPHVKNNHDGAIKGPWNQGPSDRATDPRLLDRGADIRLPERPADVRLGRGKRPSPDTDNAWHRRLSSPRIEHGIDDRFASSKELEDRLRPPLPTNLELAEIGKPSFDSLFESNLKPGQHMMRPPLPLSDFSVVGGTRGMRNVLESAHPPPRSGTPPIPSPTGSGLGNLFGGTLPNLPPSNVPSYSILKHLQRQPTPPPPPQLPMQPLPPPPPLSSLSHQLQIPSFSRHQTQLKSSFPGSQFSQHMQGNVLQNMKNQLPQPLPFLQHLQVQPPQILPPSQPQPPPPPPQVPDSMLSFPQLQSHSQVQQARPINFALESVQNGVIEPAAPNTSNLLAQFLQSGLIPPSQASQLLTEPQPPQSQHSTPQPQPPPESPSQSQTDLGSQPSMQMKPPLPSGPPPMQFLNHITASFHSSSMLLPPSVPSSGGSSTSIRSTQPPLPPGPPPTSTIVGGPASNISSLLSSLMAHGLISASLPSSSALTPGGGTDSLPVPAAPNPPLDALRNATKILPASNVPILTPPMHLPSSDGINQTSSGLQNDAIGTEFKQEILRERHESVINSLYLDFPRQCKTCGLRFKAQEEHSKHMDWHVARNRRQKNQKKSSRMWFVSVKEWLGGTGTSVSEVARPFFAEESPVEVAEDNERLAVPADENQSACALCGEPFEDFYSDETDEWMYKGAVYMNIPPGNSIEGLDGSALGPIVHAKCRTESDAAAAANFVDMDKEEVQARSDEVREENCHLPQVDISKVKEELEPTGGPRKRVRY